MKKIEALKKNEIDMIFHFNQYPNAMEKYHFACTNTTWTYNLIAVTNKPHFNENDENRRNLHVLFIQQNPSQ